MSSCVVWLCATLLAQAEVAPLTLSEALNRAETHSPASREGAAAVAVTSAARVDAALWLPANPQVQAYAGGGSDGTSTGPQGGLRVEQQLDVFGQPGLRVKEVDARVAVAEAQRKAAVQRVRADVMERYVGAQVLQLVVRDAETREALARSFADAVGQRFSSGAVPETDLLLARAEVARASVELERARLEVVEKLNELGRLVQWEPGQPLTVTPALDAPAAPDGSPADWLTRALEQRVEPRVFSLEQQAFEARLTRAAREALPSPSLFVEWQRTQPVTAYVLWGGVSVPLPLVRRNQGEQAVARSEQARVELSQALFNRDLALELQAAGSAFASTRAQWRRFLEEVEPPLDQALSAVERGTASGKFDVFRVLQLQRERADARRQERALLQELWRARIRLHRLMGDL